MFALNSVCRIDDGDVTGCSMGQIEAALGVEAVGGAALDRVKDEASVADREASEVSVGGFHARHASHDIEDFDRRVGGGEKGGVVVKRPCVRHVAAGLHVGVAANRCVYKEVATGTALDAIDGCVLVKGECVGVVHVIHQGEQERAWKGLSGRLQSAQTRGLAESPLR